MPCYSRVEALFFSLVLLGLLVGHTGTHVIVHEHLAEHVQERGVDAKLQSGSGRGSARAGALHTVHDPLTREDVLLHEHVGRHEHHAHHLHQLQHRDVHGEGAGDVLEARLGQEEVEVHDRVHKVVHGRGADEGAAAGLVGQPHVEEHRGVVKIGEVAQLRALQHEKEGVAELRHLREGEETERDAYVGGVKLIRAEGAEGVVQAVGLQVIQHHRQRAGRAIEGEGREEDIPDSPALVDDRHQRARLRVRRQVQILGHQLRRLKDEGEVGEGHVDGDVVVLLQPLLERVAVVARRAPSVDPLHDDGCLFFFTFLSLLCFACVGALPKRGS